MANPAKGRPEDKAEDAEPTEFLKLPVPSSDPADPLNWAPWRKFALLLVGSFYAFTANFASANIAPALSLWFPTFPQEPKTFPELVYFIAVRITTTRAVMDSPSRARDRA